MLSISLNRDPVYRFLVIENRKTSVREVIATSNFETKPVLKCRQQSCLFWERIYFRFSGQTIGTRRVQKSEGPPANGATSSAHTCKYSSRHSTWCVLDGLQLRAWQEQSQQEQMGGEEDRTEGCRPQPNLFSVESDYSTRAQGQLSRKDHHERNILCRERSEGNISCQNKDSKWNYKDFTLLKSNDFYFCYRERSSP